MKTLVLHHDADFDGIFCREIARKFIPDATLIGWDYGKPVPVIPDDVQRIYMLDISIDSLMDDPRLIWIDHHKTAIEKYLPKIQAIGPNQLAYCIDGVAACRLAWQWFINHEPKHLERQAEILHCRLDYQNRAVIEPLAVRLVGEYDIWDKRDPRAELFQHGLRSRYISDFDWRQMLSSEQPSMEEFEKMAAMGFQDILDPDGTRVPAIVHGLLESGKALQYARTEENASIIKAAGFTVYFSGLCFLACNAARFNSLLFTAGLKPEHDGCLGFCWREGKWKISLYHAPGKEHHDLSQIAKAYKGGGHRGACGFECAVLPFSLVTSEQSQ